MKPPAKCRHQLYLDADISERLETLASKPGASKSAILADAVQAWLTRRGTHELDDRFGVRLERIPIGYSPIGDASEARSVDDGPKEYLRVSLDDPCLA